MALNPTTTRDSSLLNDLLSELLFSGKLNVKRRLSWNCDQNQNVNRATLLCGKSLGRGHQLRIKIAPL
jgi:hypothetical protein